MLIRELVKNKNLYFFYFKKRPSQPRIFFKKCRKFRLFSENFEKNPKKMQKKILFQKSVDFLVESRKTIIWSTLLISLKFRYCRSDFLSQKNFDLWAPTLEKKFYSQLVYKYIFFYSQLVPKFWNFLQSFVRKF